MQYTHTLSLSLYQTSLFFPKVVCFVVCDFFPALPRIQTNSMHAFDAMQCTLGKKPSWIGNSNTRWELWAQCGTFPQWKDSEGKEGKGRMEDTHTQLHSIFHNPHLPFSLCELPSLLPAFPLSLPHSSPFTFHRSGDSDVQAQGSAWSALSSLPSPSSLYSFHLEGQWSCLGGLLGCLHIRRRDEMETTTEDRHRRGTWEDQGVKLDGNQNAMHPWNGTKSTLDGKTHVEWPRCAIEHDGVENKKKQQSEQAFPSKYGVERLWNE